MAADLTEDVPTSFLVEALQYCRTRHTETEETTYLKVADVLQNIITKRERVK